MALRASRVCLGSQEPRVREASTGPLVKVKGENLESLDQRVLLERLACPVPKGQRARRAIKETWDPSAQRAPQGRKET